MNLLNMRAIEKAAMGSVIKHLKNIKYIEGLQEEEGMKCIDVFIYGRIVGTQEERSRRQGRAYEPPILVDDVSMELINLINFVLIDLAAEEEECFLNDLALWCEGRDSSDKSKSLALSIIKCIRTVSKKKALN